MENANKPANAKVSLIVPMYCCENFVDTFLDELCGQAYCNIEIICVVDGSPDRTLELVEKYTQKDERVHVYLQEHKGSGAARNFGLSHATGEYVMFPDADDEYASNYISRMVQAIERSHADISVCQVLAVDAQLHTRAKNRGYSFLFYPEDRAIPTTSIKGLTRSINPIPHNKIFKRDFLIENGLLFSETMSLNDVFFSASALISAKDISFVKDHLITYIKHRNPQSISTTRSTHPGDMVFVYRQLYEWLVEKGVLKTYFSDFLMNWTGSMHSYARICQGTVFTDSIVRELVCEAPWKDMTDRELQNGTLLNCAIAKRVLKKQRSKLKQTAIPAEQTAIQRRILAAEREIENCTEIKRRLQHEYGRKYSDWETVAFIRIRQARHVGLITTAQIVYRRLLSHISP